MSSANGVKIRPGSPGESPAAMRRVSPSVSVNDPPPATGPVRIFGPLRSCRIATGRARRPAASRIASNTSRCDSCVPWEKFSRNTSTPAARSASRTSGAVLAGPMVATILVCLMSATQCTLVTGSSSMSERLKEFREFRERMNSRILESGNLDIKRFFALDTRAYEAGALPVKTKELMGLVASLVLRCDDCITYHIVRCREEGVTREECYEAFNVALVVGGSITIPHLRRAVATLDEVEAQA